MKDAKIIPLQQLYLSALACVAASDSLDAVQQDLGPDAGRLWLVRDGSTVPQAQVAYKFGIDDVVLGVITRDERELTRTVRYAEGLDGFLADFSRFLHANRLTHHPSVVK